MASEDTNDALKDELKAFISDQIKRFNKSFSQLLNDNIVAPMTEAIEKVGMLMTDVDALKTYVANTEKMDRPESPIDGSRADQPGLAGIDDAITLLPTHIEESMNFVLLMVTMVDGKRKYTADEMAERIRNDYGIVMGKHLVSALASAMKESRKQGLKMACESILKKMEGVA